MSRDGQAQANYRLAPVGGRTTLVGGTGLAYGRDSASAYLNPATIVRIDPGRLSFSVNFYSISLVTQPNGYAPGPIDRTKFGDVHSDDASVATYDFDSLPGSLCIFLRAADVSFLSRADAEHLKERNARLGICLASVQSSTYAFSAENYLQTGAFGRTRQASSVRETLRRFAIGPSYAMYVDAYTAIGASLHFSRASLRSNIGNSATTEPVGVLPISSIFYDASRGDSHELSLTLGATYRRGHQTVAFVIEAPSLHLFGSGGIDRYTSTNQGAQATASSTSADGSFAANMPLRIALGTGYEAARGSIELDVGMHVPVANAYDADFSGRTYTNDASGAVDRESSLTIATRARGAVNIGIGGEYYLSNSISLLGGVGTDLSTVPGGVLGQDPVHFFPAKTNRLATSFGVGSHGEGGDLLVGGEFSYGWGDRLAVNPYQSPPRLETTPEHSYTLLLVVAGSTSFRTIKRAVDDVTKALDPTKPAAPATTPAPTAPGVELTR